MPVLEQVHAEGYAPVVQQDADRDHSYLQNWNPIMQAADLPTGAIMGTEFLGSRVIVYRDKSGAPVVQTAFCPHLGADLAGGELVDGEVRCPYHHWQFGNDGRCTRIPSINTPPPRVARIHNYPAAEKWGIIWAFNGDEPLYDVPGFLDVEEDEMIFRNYHHGRRNCEPWLPTSNSFDFQHLSTVHGIMDVHASGVEWHQYHATIRQDTPTRKVNSAVYGGTWSSLHAMYGDDTERFFMAGSNQVGPQVSDSFLVFGMRKRDAEKLAPEELEQSLERQLGYLKKIYAEDDEILFQMRLRPRGKAALIAPDVHLAKFFDWLAAYPKRKPLD